MPTASPATRRVRTSWQCTQCQARAPRWVGRCPECQAWGTLTEIAGARARLGAHNVAGVATPATPIGEVPLGGARARPTGVDELDRVLGGGLVPGAVVLVAGEPGVGKSTLLLTVAAACASEDSRVLLVSGEESAAQVRMRAERTGAVHPQLFLAAETDLAAVMTHVDGVQPSVLVVDSVQTLTSADVDGSAGGVTQVREVTATLTRLAKTRGIATVLVGHVTKDGTVAGPRVLEHLVDVVLHFEGERHSSLRLVRAGKNRFGAADEVGCFEMTDTGIRGVADPSGLFLSSRDAPVPGTCVTVALEGRRAVVAEVQALVCDGGQVPRRAVSGLDAARVAMLLAVAERRAGVRLVTKDVYAATVGGVRLTEPAADLAVALAVASAARDLALPPTFVTIGEVSLSGEVRPVPGTERRLAEAARLGFTTALVPVGTGGGGTPLHTVEVPDLQVAFRLCVEAFATPDRADRPVH